MAKQTQRLIKGTLILTLAGILAKIVSAFYKIPLDNLTGTIGLGYYQSVYPLYALLTAMALIGIPNSISKLVAEDISLGEYKKAHATFKYAFILTGIVGIVVSMVLLLGGRLIVKVVPALEPGAYYTLMGFSVAPLFIAVAGAIRGYLQGMQIMLPTAISQIIENTFKVVIGIGFVVLLQHLNRSLPEQVGGAALGTSLGFILAALFLLIVYLKKRKDIKERIKESDATYSFREVAPKIAKIAIPITIASSALSIMLMVDSMTLPVFLSKTIHVDNQTIAMGTYVNGIFSKVQTIINVPLVISVSLIISVVPSISAANTKIGKDELRQKICEGIEIALKLALPAAVGITVLATPIMNLIWKSPEGATYLQGMAVALIFMILAQSLTGMLQGLSHYMLPVGIVGIAMIAKIITNGVLMISPLGAYGAIIGTFVYYVIITGVSYYAIKRETRFSLDALHSFIKPLASSLIMGCIVYLVYEGSHHILHSNVLSIIIAVTCGLVIYGISMIQMKAFSEDELMSVPFGRHIIERQKKGSKKEKGKKEVSEKQTFE